MRINARKHFQYWVGILAEWLPFIIGYNLVMDITIYMLLEISSVTCSVNMTTFSHHIGSAWSTSLTCHLHSVGVNTVYNKKNPNLCNNVSCHRVNELSSHNKYAGWPLSRPHEIPWLFPDFSSRGKQRLPGVECLPIWSTVVVSY